MLNLFEECSGLRLNSSKSEAIWLGKNAHSRDTLFEFTWPQRPILALGKAFSYNVKLREQENFGSKLIKVNPLTPGFFPKKPIFKTFLKF